MIGRLVLAAAVLASAVGFATTTVAEERELHSDEARNKLAGFEYTGKSQRWLPLSRIREIDVLDDWTLLIEMHDHTSFVTHLPNRCTGLAVNDRFTHTLRGNNSRLSDLDLITVLFTDGRKGRTCGLAKFEELSKKEAESER